MGSGSTPRGGSESYKLSGIPLIRSMNVHFDGLKLEGLAYLDDKQADELKNVEVRVDDVLLNITGASIGRVTQAPLAMEGARVNQHVCIIRTLSVLDPKFLCNYLASPIVQKWIVAEEYGATRQALTKQMILNFDIPLPPIAEQERIVAKIEELRSKTQKAREALEAIPEMCDRFRQSVLAAAFRGDLTADWREENSDVESAEDLVERIKHDRRKRWEEFEFERLKARGKVAGNNQWQKKYQESKHNSFLDSSELPNKWCWVKWEQVGLCQNGRAFPSKEYQAEGVKLLRPGNLHVSGSIEWNESNTRFMSQDWAIEYPDYLIRANELVINLTAQSLADEFLGRICLTAVDEECLLNQRIARLTPIVISPKFVFWLFKSRLFRDYVDGLNTGSLIQHMFTSQIDEFCFPLPPLDEQEAIVQSIEARLDAIEKIRESAKETIRFLPNLDRSILAKAFRGELVPQDPNDEPASVLLGRIREERSKVNDRKSTKRKK